MLTYFYYNYKVLVSTILMDFHQLSFYVLSSKFLLNAIMAVDLKQIEDLKKKLQTLKAKKLKLEKEVKSQLKQNGELWSNYIELKRGLDELEDKNDDMEEEQDDLEAQIKKLKAANKQNLKNLKKVQGNWVE